LNKKNTGVQEFRSSGVQENPEPDDLPGVLATDRTFGERSVEPEQGLQSPISFLSF
jgi:hypothetical protein